MIHKILAQNVRRMRTDAGLTQRALASACNLHQTYISDIERARRNVTLDVIQRLAQALRVTPCELIELAAANEAQAA